MAGIEEPTTVSAVKEKETPNLVFTLTDAAGAAVALSAIQGAELSFFDLADSTQFINSRNSQNVLNANDVVIVDGQATWFLTEADLTLLDATSVAEDRRAIFMIRYLDAGARERVAGVIHDFRVTPLTNRPSI